MIKVTKISCRWAPRAAEYDKTFNSIKEDFSDKEIVFIEIDCSRDPDEYEEIISTHDILGIPCLIVEQKGKIPVYFEGNRSIVELREFINNLLGVKSKYIATSLDKYPKIPVGIYDVIWIGDNVQLEDKKNNFLLRIWLDREAPSAVYPCKMEVFEDGSIKILKIGETH